jgi:nucleoside-specific outer membrane channel protein Tsx
MTNLNHTKAYILGLLVGGGKIDKHTFIIDLPFKKWGMDTKRMNVIATDILTRICNYFNTTYKFNVTYEIGNSKWLIKPIDGSDFSEIIEDLNSLGLPSGGFLLAKANLTKAKTILKDIQVESFLSGIFDARASLTLSHRRFTDDAPVVSIEIPGSTKNFLFVVQLCSWLTELGSVTDQILYNHPNQHSSSDPNYKGWKKGFKIRFLVKSFLTKHSFALQAKAIDVTNIKKAQNKEEQTPCYLRKLRKPSAVSVHIDQNSTELPIEVRNKLFFHYHHFCALLNCPFAPVDEIKKLVKNANEYVTFFPRLTKDNFHILDAQFDSIKEIYFPESTKYEFTMKVEDAIENENLKSFIGIDQGIAYLFAAELNGKRHTGSMSKILKFNKSKSITIYSYELNFDSPILIKNSENDRAFICSSIDNSLNQKIIKQKIKINGLAVSVLDNE